MKTRSIFNIFELLSLNSHNKLVRFSPGDTQDQGLMLDIKFLRPKFTNVCKKATVLAFQARMWVRTGAYPRVEQLKDVSFG
jgi:hypothetical protein